MPLYKSLPMVRGQSLQYPLISQSRHVLYKTTLTPHLSRFEEAQDEKMLGSLGNGTTLSLIQNSLRLVYVPSHGICKVKSTNSQLIEKHDENYL